MKNKEDFRDLIDLCGKIAKLINRTIWEISEKQISPMVDEALKDLEWRVPLDSLCLPFLSVDTVCSAVNGVRDEVMQRDKQRFILLSVSTSIDIQRINTWTRTLDRSLAFFTVGISPFQGGNFTERCLGSIGCHKCGKRSSGHAKSFEEGCCVRLSHSCAWCTF
jgi:hypothetical protein